MSPMNPKRTWILWVGSALLFALVLIPVLLDSPPFLEGLTRVMALAGYLSIFLASLMSLYTRQLVRYFGRPFQKLHHLYSIGGLALLAIHGTAVAINVGSLTAYLPDFSSFYDFFRLAGRPALWLFAITTLTALWRKSFRKQWRQIHWLNYLAFAFGTIHGIMIGTDFQSLLVKVLSVIMTVALIAAFVWKRVERQRRIQAAKSK